MYIRDMIWGGVWGALALFLPLLLHPFGLGSHLMPMFLPLLVAGCTLQLRTGIVLAVSIPLISSLFTGMPPFYPPLAVLMVLEAVSMNIWLFWSYRKRRWNIHFSLIVAFLIQRVVRVLFILAAREIVPLPAAWLFIPALIWGVPGAVIQTGVIPWVVRVIEVQFCPVGPRRPAREDTRREIAG
ncbi:MAG: hypothetical protein V1789_04700 [PVC group bacterium]